MFVLKSFKEKEWWMWIYWSMSETLDHVTVATLRTTRNRYISSYFAMLKKHGFQLVSTAVHTKDTDDWRCVYVFEHKEDEGIPRAKLIAAIEDLTVKHLARDYSAPPLPGFPAEVWARNQRVDYFNEAKVWAD